MGAIKFHTREEDHLYNWTVQNSGTDDHVRPLAEIEIIKLGQSDNGAYYDFANQYAFQNLKL